MKKLDSILPYLFLVEATGFFSSYVHSINKCTLSLLNQFLIIHCSRSFLIRKNYFWY